MKPILLSLSFSVSHFPLSNFPFPTRFTATKTTSLKKNVGLPLVYDAVRIRRRTVSDAFLEIFRSEGCRMLEMSCELHDSYAAGSQFITHTTGRVLAKLGTFFVYPHVLSSYHSC